MQPSLDCQRLTLAIQSWMNTFLSMNTTFWGQIERSMLEVLLVISKIICALTYEKIFQKKQKIFSLIFSYLNQILLEFYIDRLLNQDFYKNCQQQFQIQIILTIKKFICWMIWISICYGRNVPDGIKSFRKFCSLHRGNKNYRENFNIIRQYINKFEGKYFTIGYY